MADISDSAIALDARVEPDVADGPTTSSDLFGRRLLYVIVWATQLASAAIISPVLAHMLGSAQFGQLASAIALHQLLITLALLGLDQAVILQRSRDADGVAARGLLAVGSVFAVLLTLGIGASAFIWSGALGFGGVTSLLVATILWTAPGAVGQMMMALLSAEDRLRSFAFISILSGAGGQIFGIILLLTYGRSAGVYAWGGVIGQFSAVAVGYTLTRPRYRGLFEWTATRRAIAIGLPLTLQGLSGFVLNAGDRIILLRDLGSSAVGRYQVAYTVAYVVILLVQSTNLAWTPRIASIADRAERWRVIARARDSIYQALLPVILGVTLSAPILLRLFAPASYQPAGLLIVVYLVTLSAVPFVDGGSTASALVTSARARPVAVAAGVAALANIAMNIVLVPRIGIAGSAAATALAFGIQAFALRIGVRRIAPLPRIPRSLVLSLLAVSAVAGITILLPQSEAWNIGRFLVAAACLPWFLDRIRRARRVESKPAFLAASV